MFSTFSHYTVSGESVIDKDEYKEMLYEGGL